MIVWIASLAYYTTLRSVFWGFFLAVPQQGDMFHAAPDRGAVFTGGPRRSHSTTVLDHQSQETTGVLIPSPSSLLDRSAG